MRKNLIKIIRFGLRIHSIFHFIEFISAIYEEAYITASIAFIASLIEIVASFLLPKEHVHLKPFISEVHEDCKD
ncbi:MAG: hypothetical protein HOC22_04325 [Cryomorphaceae bacterium]|jgi:hypothetical protein|nr:hypothetical protein [Cryomorphaceae bacterium]MBT4293960.1 hypothetical protein [Cryomorphaceae bacterium]MBT4517896.1 hypothetical protein [Cryomorphaceae bacterium]MBT4834763.1 hypothetical protein [Cryomorphaceae bacterium]MBT6214123.1 hypothetical protein [Cryomorphaceae bacterium]|tara:strand:- start:746 stop:967 length:222 start_codon:yes stop_codon:yes gene_type:complete